ncbi:MAG TPA: hypothetical protein VGZ48_00835 [Candidatus Acidoferrales bacterium]|nr:hypothetical protein [Candidatus Acidoferrales bacterium]
MGDAVTQGESMGTVNIALEMERAVRLAHNERPLESALAFLASRSRESARQLSAPANEVFTGIADAAEQLLCDVLEARTTSEFEEAFDKSFPKYAAVTVALTKFAQAVVPQDALNRLRRESICEMEADIRDKALNAFGAVARDQLLFTAWTIRKIHDLVLQMSTIKIAPERCDEDSEYCRNFAFHIMRANFSLDCFNMALRVNRSIYPEVMEGLKDGLRSIVNAYAWARSGALLRANPSATIEEAPIWDEEEEDLLNSSMHDMQSLLDAEDKD